MRFLSQIKAVSFYFIAFFSLIGAAISAPIFTKADYAIIMDSDNGTLLFQKQADVAMKPSSMTKLMTLYIIFDQLRNGLISLEDTINVSEKAAAKGGSKMFIASGSRVTIKDLIQGIATQSGNDACIAVAEHFASSESNFADMMNQKAAEIGLTNSHFKNSTGWPAEGHVMSTADIALLSQKLIQNFPEYYHFLSQESFTYSNITQKNRNLLLFREQNVDGLKTGHTEEAGYGIAISAKRGNQRLIVVVNGLDSEAERADEAQRLLNIGFNHFKRQPFYAPQDAIAQAPVWHGKSDIATLVSKEPIIAYIAKDQKPVLSVSYNTPLKAPINQDTPIATLIISSPTLPEQSFPLYSRDNIKSASLGGRSWQNFRHNLTHQLGL